MRSTRRRFSSRRGCSCTRAARATPAQRASSSSPPSSAYRPAASAATPLPTWTRHDASNHLQPPEVSLQPHACRTQPAILRARWTSWAASCEVPHGSAARKDQTTCYSAPTSRPANPSPNHSPNPGPNPSPNPNPNLNPSPNPSPHRQAGGSSHAEAGCAAHEAALLRDAGMIAAL